jgi:capsid assembly protease
MKNPDEIDLECGACSTTAFTRAVIAAASDASVAAIVIDADSPGGQTLGCLEAASAVRSAASVKPVIAYTGGLMCSAAYWACAGASAVYASRMALVGSIGCYSVVGDTSEYYKAIGVKMHLIKSGANKGDGAFGTPVPESMIKRVQGLVDQIGAMFRDDVRAGRPAVKDDAMEGQEFLGADAIGAGLIDSIASFDQAVADAGALAGMGK